MGTTVITVMDMYAIHGQDTLLYKILCVDIFTWTILYMHVQIPDPSPLVFVYFFSEIWSLDWVTLDTL